MHIKLSKDVPESEQEGGFMNATLQSAGDEVAFSINTSLRVPPAICSRGQDAIAAYIQRVLSPVALENDGLSFEVQIGPSREAERSTQRQQQGS